MRRTVDLFLGLFVAVFVISGLIWMLAAPGTSFAQDDPATLRDQMASEDDDVRLVAVIDAGKLGNAPVEIIDRLLELTLDHNELVRISAERSLGKIGAPVNERLKVWMAEESVDRYLMATGGVRALGPDGANWVPAIIRKLNTDDYRTKMGSLFALVAIGPASEPALDRVIELLQDPEFQVQQVSCRVIAAIGPKAKRAGPALAEMINEDRSVSARTHAMIALGAIGPVEGVDSVGILREWVNAFTVTDRERSLEGLALLGPLAVSAKDDVEKLMLDRSKSVMPNAAYTYWRITGDQAKALELLVLYLDKYDFRNASLVKLGEMGPAAASATGKIALLLTSDEAGIRESALLALKGIGPAAREAIPHVRVVAESDEDQLLRDMAKEVLESISAPESGGKPGGNGTGRH